MKTTLAGLAFAAVLGLAGAARAQPIQVVELFTSQGCSSCPPADLAVAQISARPEILALSFGVTYWDDLGWKDTFGQKKFTDRQWDYAHGLRHAQVATPPRPMAAATARPTIVILMVVSKRVRPGSSATGSQGRAVRLRRAPV